MKKIFSILLVAILIVTSLATVALAAESATVSASNVTAKAGDTVTVNFSLSGGKFASYGMQITADPILSLTGIQKGAASDGAFVGNSKNGVVGFGGTYNCNPGVIFSATFKVSESAKPGKYPVSVKMDFVSDEKQNDLNVSVVTGYVTIVCEHSWGQWKTITPSTCVVAGKAERICSKCGEKESKSLPLADHSWGAWKTVTASTCSVAGKAERTCSVCGEKESKSLPLASHSWGAWKTVVEPTCSATGKAERVCSVGGEKETKVLPVVAHSWGAWKTVTEPTCTTEGKAERVCSVGGEKESKTLPEVAHKWGEWKTVQPALCGIDGKAERVCSVGGEKETKVLPALEHIVSEDWLYNDTEHWHICDQGCGMEFDVAAHELKWVITKNPTSTKPGLKHQECEICDFVGEDVEIPADPDLDDVPPTGDITPFVISIVVAVLGILVLVAYVIKRQFAQRQF